MLIEKTIMMAIGKIMYSKYDENAFLPLFEFNAQYIILIVTNSFNRKIARVVNTNFLSKCCGLSRSLLKGLKSLENPGRDIVMTKKSYKDI